MSSPQYRSAAARRRSWLLERLADADGITYDALVGETVAEFPAKSHYLTRVRAVRAVRDLLFDELATTEPDESIYLTPAGWRALESAMAPAGGAAAHASGPHEGGPENRSR